MKESYFDKIHDEINELEEDVMEMERQLYEENISEEQKNELLKMKKKTNHRLHVLYSKIL